MTTVSKEAFYQSVVDQYKEDAEKYFATAKVVPDNGDMAYCIIDFWNDDRGVVGGEDEAEFRGIYKALTGQEIDAKDDDSDMSEEEIQSASDAGIPMSVIEGKTKLRDVFSQEYITAQKGGLDLELDCE